MKRKTLHLWLSALLCALLLVGALPLGGIFSVSAAAISSSHQAVAVGRTCQLSASGTGTITWSSSDSSVASVSSTGLVSANKLGQAVITATDSAGNALSCTITSGYYWGIDVSKHNGTCDWDKIAAAGIDFAMIRVGYGKDDYPTQVDGQFAANVEGAVQHDIPFGLYFYSYATTASEAEEEADYLLRAIDDYIPQYKGNIVLPIAYDVEESKIINNLTTAQVTQIVLSFCEKVRAAGYTPMIYSFKSLLQTGMNLSTIAANDVLIWEAQWPATVDFSGVHYLENYSGLSDRSPDIWQYASDGSLDGANTASGTVDVDLIYIDSALGRTITKQGESLSLSGVSLNGSAVLNWNDLAGADTLELHRTDSAGSDIVLTSQSAPFTSFVDSTFGWKTGTYSYYVKALADGETYLTSNLAELTCSEQKTYSATAASYLSGRTQNAVCWDSVTGADAYYVYRNGTYVGETDAGTTSLDVTALKDGVYTVRAFFHCADGAVLYLDLSGGAILPSGTPEAVSLSIERTSSVTATLSWSENALAQGYQIYKNGEYYSWSTATSFDITYSDAQEDVYQVLVQCKAADESTLLSELSNTVSTDFTLPLAESSITLSSSESGFTVVTVTAQTGEDVLAPTGWLLYRDGTLETLLEGTNTYTFYQDAWGSEHTYTVQGYRRSGDTIFY